MTTKIDAKMTLQAAPWLLAIGLHNLQKTDATRVTAVSPSPEVDTVPQVEPRVDSEKQKKMLAETMEFFQKFVQRFQFDLKFLIDEKSRSVVIQLFEKGTDKLIRQIPPEEILRLKQRISELLGVIFDERV